jgi:hypothetical protein
LAMVVFPVPGRPEKIYKTGFLEFGDIILISIIY